jgi:hypothetical protein
MEAFKQILRGKRKWERARGERVCGCGWELVRKTEMACEKVRLHKRETMWVKSERAEMERERERERGREKLGGKGRGNKE